MKKLLALILLAMSLPVTAQQYAATTLVAGGTNDVAAASTKTYDTTIVVTKFAEVALQIAFKLTGAGTDTITTTLDYSVDGSNWETAKPHTWALAANGTTLVVATTNITVGSYGYLRLKSIQNAAASEAVTNLLFKVATKPKRQG